MARTDVPITRTSRYQVNAALAADVVAGDTVNGMRMSNNGATMLRVANSAGVVRTIDLIIVETVDFAAAGPTTLSVPANTVDALIGPFPVNFYGNVLEFDVSSNSLGFLAFSLI